MRPGWLIARDNAEQAAAQVQADAAAREQAAAQEVVAAALDTTGGVETGGGDGGMRCSRGLGTTALGAALATACTSVCRGVEWRYANKPRT